MHLLNALAWCSNCEWGTEGKNSMGNAAKHYQKTGHHTMVELYYSQHFGEPNPERQPLIVPRNLGVKR